MTPKEAVIIAFLNRSTQAAAALGQVIANQPEPDFGEVAHMWQDEGGEG